MQLFGSNSIRNTRLDTSLLRGNGQAGRLTSDYGGLNVCSSFIATAIFYHLFNLCRAFFENVFGKRGLFTVYMYVRVIEALRGQWGNRAFFCGVVPPLVHGLVNG